jgi:hypothetical protein
LGYAVEASPHELREQIGRFVGPPGVAEVTMAEDLAALGLSDGDQPPV